MRDKIAYILDCVKTALFIFMMTAGFWFTYAFIWYAMGLPQEDWALLVCFVLAALSDYGYITWLRL